MADLRFTLTSTTSQTADNEGEGGLQPRIHSGAESSCILGQNLGPTELIWRFALFSSELMGLRTSTHHSGKREEC